MRAPSPTLRYLRRAFLRGRLDEVRIRGDGLAETAAGDPRQIGDLAEMALLIGAAHAAADELVPAEAYLEAGLERWSAEHEPGSDAVRPPSAAPTSEPPGWADTALPDRPPEHEVPAPESRWAPPPPPRPPGPPGWAPAPTWSGSPWNEAPWTDAAGRRPFDPAAPWVAPPRHGPVEAWAPGYSVPSPARAPMADWYELLLCEVHLRTGRTSDASRRLTRLVEPHRDVATRFGATRALATVSALAGNHERAHHLLNTAAGLAARIPSRFRGALVDADRAVVLSREGRLNEALAVGERVLGPLIRPPSGPYQLWARREAAAMALAVSRAAARAGDALSATRLLEVGRDAVEPMPDHFLHAHLLLTSAVAGAAEDLDGAEDLLSRAGGAFERSGDRPAAALVVLEQGRTAHVRGLERSARPLYEQAAAELRTCGWMAEAGEADSLRSALAAGHLPTFRYGNVP